MLEAIATALALPMLFVVAEVPLTLLVAIVVFALAAKEMGVS